MLVTQHLLPPFGVRQCCHINGLLPDLGRILRAPKVRNAIRQSKHCDRHDVDDHAGIQSGHATSRLLRSKHDGGMIGRDMARGGHGGYIRRSPYRRRTPHQSSFRIDELDVRQALARMCDSQLRGDAGRRHYDLMPRRSRRAAEGRDASEYRTEYSRVTLVDQIGREKSATMDRGRLLATRVSPLCISAGWMAATFSTRAWPSHFRTLTPRSAKTSASDGRPASDDEVLTEMSPYADTPESRFFTASQFRDRPTVMKAGDDTEVLTEMTPYTRESPEAKYFTSSIFRN